MSVTSTCLVEAAYAANAETTIYTAGSGKKVLIDRVTSFSSAGGTLTLRIVASGGTAGASNAMYTKTFAAGESYTWPELVGQVLNAGDFISELAGAASTVVRRISGREVT